MPKLLTAVRHAKSSWAEPSLSDIDRPLNKRGKRAAPTVAAYLDKIGHRPDLLLSSPAKRAYRTACHFAAVFGILEEDILRDDRLYFEGEDAIAQALREQDDRYGSIFFFSHEPVISGFCGGFCGWQDYKFPTAAACGMEFDIDSWSEFGPAGKKLFFIKPKAIDASL